MPLDPEIDVGFARRATRDALNSLVRDGREEVLIAVLENPHLEEPHITALLDRLDLSARILGAVGGQGNWTSRESVRLALARHPRTPKRVALAMARQLFLFDLARLSLLPSAPADIRRAAEELILTRLPHLPVGEKLTLARRGPARIAGALLGEGHPQAIKLALDNAFLTESQVLKVLAKSDIPERSAAAVAQHRKWSRLYNVRVALVRNPVTPQPMVRKLLPVLTLRDLKEFARLETVPPLVRRYAVEELRRRLKGTAKRERA